MTSAYKSKALATWIAVAGGGLGLHRFYLHGLRDPLAWCYAPPALVGLFGVQRMRAFGVTFGCFNNFSKVSDATLRLWAEVLASVPGSRLLLKSNGLEEPRQQQHVRERLTRAGIDGGRVELLGRITGLAAHLACYQCVDVALDTFPYHGTTTTCEALWMGVPVLTLKGDRYVAHMGESILHNVGLPEWIASDAAAYPMLAAKMASDLPALSALRAQLRPRMLASPLFDARRFARNFEDAIRGMWRAWCATQGRA